MPISHIQPATGTYEDWSPPYISKKKVRATKNFIQNKMTGRVNLFWRIFEKNAKKVKIEVSGTKNFIFWPISPKTVKNVAILDIVTSILTFLTSSKMRQSRWYQSRFTLTEFYLW